MSWYSAETFMDFQADLFLLNFSVFRVSREYSHSFLMNFVHYEKNLSWLLGISIML